MHSMAGTELPGNLNSDWYSVRNYTAVRAEKSLGAVRWGRSESDVVIMRDACHLEQEKSPLKLSCNTMVKSCNWCSERFLTGRHIVRHLLLKHLQWNSKCGRCRRPMTSSLIKHECESQCSVCGHTCSSRSVLCQHLYTNHEIFYCLLCERHFDNLEEMKYHMEMENLGLVTSCILCKKKFPNWHDGKSMKNHLINFHFGPELSWNSAIFEDKASKETDLELITHIALSYKPNKTERYQFDNFKCPHCHRLFSAQSGLKIHVGIAHRGEKILFCPRCPATFQSVGDCKLHLKEEHGKNRKRKLERKEADTAGGEVTVSTASAPQTVRSYVSTNMDVNGNGIVATPADDNEAVAEPDVLAVAKRSRTEEGDRAAGGSGDEEDQKQAVKVDTGVVVLPAQDMPAGRAVILGRRDKVRRPLPGLLKIADAQPAAGITLNASGKQNSGPKPPDEESLQSVQQAGENTRTQVQPQHNTHQNSGAVIIPQPRQPLANKSSTAGLKVYRASAATHSTGAREPIAVSAAAAKKAAGVPAPLPGEMKRQAAYILPKPATGLGNSFGKTVQVIFPNQVPDSAKVYVPAVTASGATVLINLEEAQEQMKKGVVKFLPTSQSALTANISHEKKPGNDPIDVSVISSSEPTTSRGGFTVIQGNNNNSFTVVQPSNNTNNNSFTVVQPCNNSTNNNSFAVAQNPSQYTNSNSFTVIQRPLISNNDYLVQNATPHGSYNSSKSKSSPGNSRNASASSLKIVSVTGSGKPPDSGEAARDKSALDLPVVLTKRSNKKLAQDNPFFEVTSIDRQLWGHCRVCKEQFSFENFKEMEHHFKEAHKQIIEIQRFSLYFEISYRPTKRAKTKFFLCYYCGKEFTTKFNARRHQMLYCPRKDEINPKELGLGLAEMEDIQGEEEEEKNHQEVDLAHVDIKMEEIQEVERFRHIILPSRELHLKLEQDPPEEEEEDGGVILGS